MSTVDLDTSAHVPAQLVDQLAKGYDALSIEVKRIHEQRQQLENKLSWAKQQYLDALKRFSPASASKDFHDFLAELEEAGAVEKEGEVDWIAQLIRSPDDDKRVQAYNIQRAADAREKISYRRKSTDAGTGVRIWAGKSADEPSECAVIEQDFTTPGTPSRLGCPFASGKLNGVNGYRVSTPRSSISRVSLSRRSKRASFHDPIRAEVCASRPISSEASIEGSVPLCPIRFLDQHSPEEVATYFEKHKHELPRSHEFCVKRFQENDEVLKNLDSKYANIVSMVKGLGDFHQPMLPDTEDLVPDEDEEGVHTSASKVEKWAQAVSNSGDDIKTEGPKTDQENEDEDRESRFDRPLKDVRVGESPSRPWGIHVPADFSRDGDAASKKSDPTASPLEESLPEGHPLVAGTSGRGCPFSSMRAAMQTQPETQENLPEASQPSATDNQSHQVETPVVLSEHPPVLQLPATHRTTSQRSSTLHQQPNTTQSTASQPQFVFNGPVFFGYPMEKAMEMLKQSGLGTQ